MQRNATLAVELGSAHLRAAEATGHLHPDALGARLHRALHGLAHRATERHPLRELLGDTLRDKLRVDLRVLHLEDVQLHLLARQLLEVATDPVGLSTAASDHNAWTCRVDVDANPITGALDLDARDACAFHALRHHAANGDVFFHVVPVQLVGVPPALEFGGDAEPEPVRVDLLAH